MITLSDSEIERTVSQRPLHIPVMLNEVMEGLQLRPEAIVLDCTVGLGQHSIAIAEKINPGGHLIGIDRDQGALVKAKEGLKMTGVRLDLVQNDFRHIDDVLDQCGVEEVDGALFDLGISSYQLDDADRGFSFQSDGPLDMRMDKSSYISAYDLVNSLSEREISTILRNFGQERWHSRIARLIVQERSAAPIASTKNLSDIVVRAIPARFRRQKIHPATRTFQAIRIAVNRELEALEIALDKCIARLRKGGRMCVISFHSLEDRIVKEAFRNAAREGVLSLVVKKPLRPSEEEVGSNSRARSARLRIAERI